MISLSNQHDRIKTRFPYFFCGIFFIVIFVILTYWPPKGGIFQSDDFYHLYARIHNPPFSYHCLFAKVNEHFHPLFNLFFSLEFQAFKLNPLPYNFASIFLHCLNTVLTIIFAWQLTSRKSIGLIAGAFFGLSRAHWHTPMWITTQGQLLATAFFLTASIFFMRYVRTKNTLFYILSALSHLCMLFSFSAGVEIPIAFAFFYLVLIYQLKGSKFFTKTKLKSSLLLSIPFLINLTIYFIARKILSHSSPGHLNLPFTSPLSFITAIAKTLAYSISFIYFRYLTSLFRLFVSSSILWYHIRLALTILLFFFYLDKTEHGTKKYIPIFFLFFIWILMILFPPFLFRLYQPFSYIIQTSRYAYLPAPLFSTLAAISFISLKCFTKKILKGVNLKAVFLSLICIVSIINNALYINQKIHQFEVLNHFMKSIQNNFINSLTVVMSQNPSTSILIVKRPLSPEYILWNVYPHHLATLYLGPSVQKRLQYISMEDALKATDLNFFWADEFGYLHEHLAAN